jgi:hypothetical protein
MLLITAHTEGTSVSLPNTERRLLRADITEYSLANGQGLSTADFWWSPLCYDMKFHGKWIDRDCPDRFYEYVSWIESEYELW